MKIFRKRSILDKLKYKIKYVKKRDQYDLLIAYKFTPIYIHFNQFLGLKKIASRRTPCRWSEDLEVAEKKLKIFCDIIREWEVENEERDQKLKKSSKGEVSTFYTIENL